MMIIRNPAVGEGLAGVVPFAKSAKYSFRVLPLFVAIGFLAMQVGIAASAYDAARKWVGRSPGGLASATIFACAGFAVVSGTATASTAVFTRMAPAEMEKRGYDRAFSAGDSTPVVKLNAKLAPCVAPPIMEKIVALREFWSRAAGYGADHFHDLHGDFGVRNMMPCGLARTWSQRAGRVCAAFAASARLCPTASGTIRFPLPPPFGHVGVPSRWKRVNNLFWRAGLAGGRFGALILLSFSL